MQQSANFFCSSGARHLYSALFTPPLLPPYCLEILLFFAMWEHPGIILDIYICASPFCNRYQAVGGESQPEEENCETAETCGMATI